MPAVQLSLTPCSYTVLKPFTLRCQISLFVCQTSDEAIKNWQTACYSVRDSADGSLMAYGYSLTRQFGCLWVITHFLLRLLTEEMLQSVSSWLLGKNNVTAKDALLKSVDCLFSEEVMLLVCWSSTIKLCSFPHTAMFKKNFEQDQGFSLFEMSYFVWSLIQPHLSFCRYFPIKHCIRKNEILTCWWF